MFGLASTTRYDLRFSIFGIPVHVTPWFWAAGVFLSWDLVSARRYDLLLIWLGCLFVSILIHECGHAFCAEWFGCRPEIFLYHFGGLAVFQPNSRFTTARSVLVSFAGPAAGFVLFGIVLFVGRLVLSTEWYAHLQPEAAYRLHFFFGQMIWINLWWGLLNLLPVLPLDGGRISEALFVRFWRFNGQRLALLLGAIVSGAAAAYFGVVVKENYAAILFALLCISNVQGLQRPSR